MKTKVLNIVQAMNVIVELQQRDLTPAVGYRLGVISGKLQPIYDQFMKVQNGLIVKYGEPVEGNPDQIKVKPENIAEVQRLIAERLDEEEEIPAMKLLRLSDLNKEAPISGAKLAMIEFLIEDDL